MSTGKTHISTSGKRVPCNAEDRPCTRKGCGTAVELTAEEKSFSAAVTRGSRTNTSGLPERKEPAPKFASQSALERRREAQDTTDQKRLEVLAKHKDMITVIKVSINRNASPELLTKLSTHKEAGVRRGVRKNPSTPMEVRRVLRNDPDPLVNLG
jgi:hypothetical protein